MMKDATHSMCSFATLPIPLKTTWTVIYPSLRRSSCDVMTVLMIYECWVELVNSPPALVGLQMRSKKEPSR